MRKPLIVGNWKMNGRYQQNAELLQALLSGASANELDKMAVCVPFVYIQQVKELLTNSTIAFGAQDLSVHVNGAYTGEVSAGMLADLHCRYVIVGHSERRQYHHESNFLVAQKALASIKAGMSPIVCVGETQEQREAQQTLDVIREQLQSVRSLLNDEALKQTVIAYEPVWAIGTGLTASPEQAQKVHEFIRKELSAVSEDMPLLYGGSVKAANAAELFAMADIDGALVGGASLDAQEFIAIAKAA